jgi:hypothetical protein
MAEAVEGMRRLLFGYFDRYWLFHIPQEQDRLEAAHQTRPSFQSSHAPAFDSATHAR